MTGPRDFSELSQYELDPASSALLPLEFCLERKVAVLGKADASPAVVAMVDPLDRGLVEEVSRRLRRPVSPVQLNAFEIRRAL